MSIEAINYVRDLKLKNPTRKLILILLADRSDEEFSCYPSIPLLAAEVEITDRAVQKHLAALRADGFISDRERRRKDGTQSSNRYFLHGPWDDYAHTGQPFELIDKPRDLRKKRWEETPLDGEFRKNTAAGKTAGHGQGELQDTLSEEDETDPTDEFSQDRVNSRTPSPVNSGTPSPVSSSSPLEPSDGDHQVGNLSLTASGGKSAQERGESEPPSPEEEGLRIAREMLAELTAKADQGLKEHQSSPGAVALPGGMALEGGKIHGLPASAETWGDDGRGQPSPGYDDQEE